MQALDDALLEEIERHRNYGTNRLTAEVALGSDIHFVCCAAVKIVLSMLSQSRATDTAASDAGSSLREFINSSLVEREHYVMFGMTPDYSAVPSHPRRGFGQRAFQSLWLTTSSREECPVCGAPDLREVPYGL